VLPLLESLIERLQPDVVIAVGQAGGRAEISLERVAINVIDARIPDNANVQPVDVPVVADGPAAYFTSLPIKAMLVALRAAGMPATVSQTAGTFVCNHVFYGLMHAAAQRPALRRAGFVHIPYLPAQAVRHPGAPSMALESIIAAMTVLAESACTGATDVRVGAGATH
jgi:pyroglutamyl-peptidase